MKEPFGRLVGSVSSRYYSRLLLAILFSPLLPAANAGVTVTVQETINGVSISASGSLNLSGLTRETNVFYAEPRIRPLEPDFTLGPASEMVEDVGDTYRVSDGDSIITPGTFGTGAPTTATSGTGSVFGLSLGVNPKLIQVPDDYTSGSPIIATARFDGATIASLGMTPGTYVWSWGSGGTAESITMYIGQSPPPVVDNTAAKAKLQKKIKKLKKQVKVAKRKKQVAKAKKLLKKAKKLTKKLRKL
ncbi:MAG: hypothetical protein CMO55_12550 [Verrucomicrobiales bacterium]|nr:hypothetical protein [Verrucomicrobiales bacterium]